jgi:multisubunit Na+/H+ antiporter MnhE subunit
VWLAVELVVWCCVTTGVWLTSVAVYSNQDLGVALGCGAACAVVAVLSRRAARLAARPPAAMLRWLGALPWSIVLDTGRVLVLPWRPRARASAGEFRRVRLGPPGNAPRAVGRRAMAAVIMSATPGAYVVDVDPGAGTALVHAVGPASPIEGAVTEGAVTR